METCETVTIETENGPVDINKSDFNEEIHTLFGEDTAPNEGTIDWYKLQLDELSVDYSEAKNKADFVSLYEENKGE